MSDPSRDLETDQRLASWLRAAGEGELGDIAGPVANARAKLLKRVELAQAAAAGSARAPSLRRRQALRLPRLLASRRVAAGGVAGSILLTIALVFVARNSAERLSAMERTTQELCAVTSYCYRLRWESTWLEKDGKRATTKGDGMNYWQAPDAFHGAMKIIKIDQDVPPANRAERVIEQFAEIFPSQQQGVMIDYHRKIFIRLFYEPIGSKTYPWDVLRMIREGSYDIQRDLGTKVLGKTTAHGFVLLLKNPRDKNTVRDPVTLWVDARTSLPLEFHYQGMNEGTTYADRVTDFRWNIEIDPKLFVPSPPAGFTDTTPPTDLRELTQIVDALRLYAQLGGGRYPQTRQFDAQAIGNQMRKLAGFDGPARPEWKGDEKYRQIERAAAGLDQIARVLRNRYLAGYRGATVAAADKDQVLLWWATTGDRYRVFYGDLRSEVLGEAVWSRLVPSDEIYGDRAGD